jgi:hypothetical protein
MLHREAAKLGAKRPLQRGDVLASHRARHGARPIDGSRASDDGSQLIGGCGCDVAILRIDHIGVSRIWQRCPAGDNPGEAALQPFAVAQTVAKVCTQLVVQRSDQPGGMDIAGRLRQEDPPSRVRVAAPGHDSSLRRSVSG